MMYTTYRRASSDSVSPRMRALQARGESCGFLIRVCGEVEPRGGDDQELARRAEGIEDDEERVAQPRQGVRLAQVKVQEVVQVPRDLRGAPCGVNHDEPKGVAVRGEASANASGTPRPGTVVDDKDDEHAREDLGERGQRCCACVGAWGRERVGVSGRREPYTPGRSRPRCGAPRGS